MPSKYDTRLEGDCGIDEDAQSREEAIQERFEQYQSDAAKLREAEECTAGEFDPEHYTAVTLALHKLHHTDPDRLTRGDLLPNLYRLAKVEAKAIDERLLSMATDDVDAEYAAAPTAAEARMEGAE